tara:strand:- start:134 stop:427 length:294 start_codon:yes stop_codon:yes gene_type:complete
MRKRKVENIVYDTSGRDKPLYECWGSTFSPNVNIKKSEAVLLCKDVDYKVCGMTNGMWSASGRSKHWLIKVKHDPSAGPFWIKKVDLDKLTDNKLLN